MVDFPSLCRPVLCQIQRAHTLSRESPSVHPAIDLALETVVRCIGLLPRRMIDADPLFPTLFIANLGSIGYPAGFHHLWEYGTTSMFGVFGRIERTEGGRRKITAAWTYDERIEDGLYSYHVLEAIRKRIERPERLTELVEPPRNPE